MGQKYRNTAEKKKKKLQGTQGRRDITVKDTVEDITELRKVKK